MTNVSPPPTPRLCLSSLSRWPVRRISAAKARRGFWIPVQGKGKGGGDGCKRWLCEPECLSLDAKEWFGKWETRAQWSS